jgi:hypothetical protein
MSFRPRGEAKAKAPAPFTAPTVASPGMDRLSHVLSVGATVTPPPPAPVVIEMTDAEFEFEIGRLVDEMAIDMTAEERKAMRDRSLQRAKDGGRYAYDQAGKARKYASEKTKEAAKEIVDYVQRAWAGAKKPAHWILQKDHTEAAKRIMKSYKMYFEKKGWENIKLAADFSDRVGPERVIFAETGMNLHAKIDIDAEKVELRVINSMPGRSDATDGKITYGTLLQTTTFPAFTAALDALIMEKTKEFYEKFKA